MAPQDPEHPAGLHLPDPNRVVDAAAGRQRAVGMERHGPDRVVVSAEGPDLASASSPIGRTIHDRDRRDRRHYNTIRHRDVLWKRPRFPWLAMERRRYLSWAVNSIFRTAEGS